jgi:hypothetical protein
MVSGPKRIETHGTSERNPKTKPATGKCDKREKLVEREKCVGMQRGDFKKLLLLTVRGAEFSLDRLSWIRALQIDTLVP